MLAHSWLVNAIVQHTVCCAVGVSNTPLQSYTGQLLRQHVVSTWQPATRTTLILCRVGWGAEQHSVVHHVKVLGRCLGVEGQAVGLEPYPVQARLGLSCLV